MEGWARQAVRWFAAVGCAAALLAGCGDPDAADGPTETVEPAPTVPVEAQFEGPLPGWNGPRSVVAHGGAYFAIAGDQPDSELIRSEDLRSWQPVDLPGSGPRMSLSLGATEPGGVLAVSGRVVETEPVGETTMDVPIAAYMVWTSADGVEWERGPVIEGLNPFDSPTVYEAGGALAAGYAEPEGRFTVLRRDGADEWQVEEIQELSRPEDQIQYSPGGYSWHQGGLEQLWAEGDALVGVAWLSPDDSSEGTAQFEVRSTDRGATWDVRRCDERDGRCGGYGLRAEGLLIRGERSSVDEGASWRDVSVQAEESCTPELSSVTKVGSGWVGVGSVHVGGGPSTDGLFHSSDGRSWTATRAPACDEAEGEGSYTYSAPVEFNGSWWSVYSEYPHLSEEAPAPRLLRSDDLGVTWIEAELAGLHGQLAGAPLAVGDELLIPIARIDPTGGESDLEGVVGLRAER